MTISSEKPHDGAAAENASRRRVLLAEDYPGNVVVAQSILNSFGYEVVVADNGQQAFDLLAAEPFDIVLMDVKMPVMDGYTATRHIRAAQQAGEVQDVRIIGVTANGLVQDREKCIAAGMDDYIAKPFHPMDLKRMLEKHLGADDASF